MIRAKKLSENYASLPKPTKVIFFTMILKEANIENATQYTTPNIKISWSQTKILSSPDSESPQL